MRGLTIANYKNPLDWSHPAAPSSLEHRQGVARTVDLAPTLLAGSSAFLASVAMNLLFLESNPSQPRECPRGWEDGSSVGMGCVWAQAKGRGVNQVLGWQNIMMMRRMSCLSHERCRSETK